MNASSSSMQVPTCDIRGFLDTALAFLQESRPFILRTLSEGLGTETKADSSIVTKADIGTEKLFRAYIGKKHPDHGILGEEFGHSNPQFPFQWVIDPIDGTAEFARNIPLYGTIIGLFYKQRPIVGIIDFPSLNETYSAALGCGAYRNETKLDLMAHKLDPAALNRRVAASPPWNFLREGGTLREFDALARAFPNLRMYHSCYTHALAASGGVDASVEWNMKIWDLAAAQILVEEAGGVCIVVDPPEDWAHGMYRMVIGSRKTTEEVASVVKAAR